MQMLTAALGSGCLEVALSGSMHSDQKFKLLCENIFFNLTCSKMELKFPPISLPELYNVSR